MRLAAAPADLTEKDFQEQVSALGTDLGWLIHQQRPRMERVQPPIHERQPPIGGLGDTLIGTDVCSLTLEGEPQSKARPRVSRTGTYTPRTTREAQEMIRWQILNASVQPDRDHVFRVTATFRCPTRKRRDLDNMLKLVLDACNGFVWGDDIQVAEIVAKAVRASSDPGTDIQVTRVGRYTSDCRQCGVAIDGGHGKPYGLHDFCSRDCSNEFQRAGCQVACPNCGAAVYRKRSDEHQLKFCSAACRNTYVKGRRHSQSDVGYPTLTLVRERLVLIETVAAGELLEAEKDWLLALLNAGVEAYLIRPRHLEALAKVLACRGYPFDRRGEIVNVAAGLLAETRAEAERHRTAA